MHVRGGPPAVVEQCPRHDPVTVADADPVPLRVESLRARVREEVRSLEHHLSGVAELVRVHHRHRGIEVSHREEASGQPFRKRHRGSRQPGHGSPLTGRGTDSSRSSADRTSPKSR